MNDKSISQNVSSKRNIKKEDFLKFLKERGKQLKLEEEEFRKKVLRSIKLLKL